MWIKKGNIFNEHHAQVPVVDVYSDTFKIYYSTRDEFGRSIPMSLILPAVNLSNYSPPKRVSLELGKPGLFDWSGIMPTDIVTLENGTKYLYYIGWSRRIDVPYHNSIGLAVSYDSGLTWTKFADGPIFHTSYKEPGYIGNLDILIENGVWKMWYLSCRDWVEYKGLMEPIYDIKFAISGNGIDWEPTNQTCIPLEKNEGGISKPLILKEDLIYHMWFSVRHKFDYRNKLEHSYRIKKATSIDGIKWVRDKNIDLDVSPKGWDSEMVAYPDIVKYKNKLLMFYNGNGFGQTGIGYAINDII